MDDTRPELGVGIIEDSAILRELFVEAVEGEDGLFLTGVAATLHEAREKIDWPQTTLASIDLHLPDGLGVDLGLRARMSYPELRIAIVSDHRRPSLFRSISIREKAYWSYILKSSIEGRAHLGGLLKVAAAMSYIDPHIEGRVGPIEEAIANLTEQQRQILALVAAGLSNGAIAKNMHLSDKSVEYHLTQIYQRLLVLEDKDVNPRVKVSVMYLQRFSLESQR